MTSDLALRPVTTSDPPRAPVRAAGPERDAGAAPPPAAPATPNPRLRLDGSLGMVVIEFRDQVGDVANTIPTPRQIAAYRAAVVSNAPVPVGVAARSEPGVSAPAAPELPAPPPLQPAAPQAQAETAAAE
ncbi:hypothetical protein [Roseomonas sp. CECT 9278]|uniref:hypothetical protein n=1 Tax=Roseomonas sp. CECT 9278 TaxID=2845823 RepID=UPI001E49E09F|nr:hypothetical protein [Roseomonas sp. CECT 9278]CAH0309529.1 hypothetical protein ROS9278_04871 [Roseomonas sp. CECT 9278]